jgi:exodeoxyribonuclease VII large subunit
MQQTRLDGQPIPLTVTELTARIKERLTSDDHLRSVWVKGEISGFKLHSRSGHAYFDLKDKKSVIQCVMFNKAYTACDRKLKDGLEVMAHGSLSVYEPRGIYELVVTSVKPSGLGELHLLVEALMKKLEEEGLFAPERKRPLPKIPKRVGVVTSESGDAFRDIVNVARRRWPGAKILLAHANVQGPGAAASISAGIDLLNQVEDVDVIIVGRGGGSEEDLFAFNEEMVARAIFKSRVPVVSAVGHEADRPISDHVADMRAPTPSAAAELVIPCATDILGNLESTRDLMEERLLAMIELRRTHLRALVESPALSRPVERVHDLREELTDITGRLRETAVRLIEGKRQELVHSMQLLASLDPKAILARGYSIILKPDGTVVIDTDGIGRGDKLKAILSRGELDVSVDRSRSKKNESEEDSG